MSPVKSLTQCLGARARLACSPAAVVAFGAAGFIVIGRAGALMGLAAPARDFGL